MVGIMFSLLAVAALARFEDNAQNRLDIPRTNSITLDGTISPGEWQAAATIESNGCTFYFMHDGANVLGAVRSPGPQVITSIYVDTGGSVRIFHASAAIGEAAYMKGADDSWKQTIEPQWFRFPRGASAEALDAAADAYLAQHGWVSTHFAMGDVRDTEFILSRTVMAFSMSSFPDPERDAGYYLPFAISLLQTGETREESKTIAHVPTGFLLNDDCTTEPLQAGFWPVSAKFETKTWMRVRLLNADKTDE